MSETGAKPRLHYAWVITFAGFIIYWFATCIVSICVGMFVTPVSEALGISRSAFSFTPNIYVFYAISLILGVCMCAVASVGVSTLISNWFNEKRGLAIALAATGSGVGGIVINPLITSLITSVAGGRPISSWAV